MVMSGSLGILAKVLSKGMKELVQTGQILDSWQETIKLHRD
jgi:hypothetical protein